MTIPESASLEYPVTPAGTVTVGETLFLNMGPENVTMTDGTVVAPGQFAVKNGRLVRLTGTDALKMWITKILKTEKNRFRAYDVIRRRSV